MNIVYRDDFIVAIHKPEGLLVHRSAIDKHETDFAVQQLRDMLGQYVYPVHRLDKPTSGVLLFALTSEIAGLMSELFRSDAIVKKYFAFVRGYTEESGEIDNPLRKIIDKYGKPVRKAEEKQEAVTLYRSLARIELPVSVDRYPNSRYSLLELTPKTGRRHQLRRHMKHISHPIIGDPKYGKSVHNNYFKEHLACPRLLLAAVSLEFTHPYSNENVKITAEPKGSFGEILDMLGFDTKEYLK